MGFSIGMETEKKQEKAVKGHYQRVAVGCWFTCTGKSMPQIMKYEDENGCLQTIYQIQVIKSEQKYYAGILSRRYDCRTIINDKEYLFTLLYHPDANLWDLVLPEKTKNT